MEFDEDQSMSNRRDKEIPSKSGDVIVGQATRAREGPL